MTWQDRFLNRAVRNFESFKRFPSSEYRQRFQQIGLTFPNPDYQPMHHQLVCIFLAIKQKALMLLVDLGLGKTATMLHTMKGLRLRGLAPKKMLVLVPTLLLISEWEKEAAIHRPDLHIVNMANGDKATRWAQLRGAGDVFVLNYDGLTALVTEFMFTWKDDTGKKYFSEIPVPGAKRKRVISPKAITEFLNLFSVVVLDEITAVKNPKSTLFQICAEFPKAIPCRYGLTGTPFGRNLQDLWGEYYVIDGGESLGRNQYIYDQVFFDMENNPFGGKDLTFRKPLLPKLKRLMYNTAIRYEQEECADLPPVTTVNLGIPMPSEMEPYYGKLHEQLTGIFTHANSGSTKSVEQLWIQSREVCSNFLNLKDPATGVTHTVPVPGEVKLERLMALINTMPEGCKMVVFTEFLFSGRRIEQELGKNNIKCIRIDGTITKGRDALLKSFNEDPAYTVAIINSGVGALGLNLQAANYTAFYEIPVDPIIYQQAAKRTARTGQKKACFFFNFFILNTVEQSVLRYVKEGKNLHDQLMKNPRALQGVFHG